MLGILLAVVAAAILIILLMWISGRSKKGAGERGKDGKKNPSVLARECTKKLSKDPHNVQALQTLSECMTNY